jgi:3-dehydroquinate dehydratase/shikimate dehydrogenase
MGFLRSQRPVGRATRLAMSSDHHDIGSETMPTSGRIFGLVGPTTTRSISPRLHGGAYRALGLADHHFLAFPLHHELELEALLCDRRWASGTLDGLTITAPFKERALALASEAEPQARQCGAANLLVRTTHGWRAETTDALGVLRPLRRRGIELVDRRAIVVGCGGAGRAAAVGLLEAGARVLLANRHAARGRFASALLGLPWVGLDELDVSAGDIVVNATPLGRDGEAPAFDARTLPPGAIVVDFVYAEQPTPLAEQARAAGHEVIDGREVLAVEVALQFERMTGHALDEALAHELAGWSSVRVH